MTKDELIAKLKSIKQDDNGDAESRHYEADMALLDYIADEAVRQAFMAIERWYA